MRSLLAGLALLLTLPLFAGEPAGFKPIFNGKDTSGWVLRQKEVTIPVYFDAEGKKLVGAKMTKVDQKEVVVDSKNVAINGATLVEKDGKKTYLDLQGKVIEGAKIAKIGGRDAVVDATGKVVEKAKVVMETSVNPNGWTVVDGVLVCSSPHGGNDILTEEKFTDCELHIEFLASSNSGVYLQGRYEIQINNDFGVKPKVVEVGGKQVETLSKNQCGAIYNFVAPSKNMAKKPDEWQSFDITFHAARPATGGNPASKARATVVWNGEKVIDNAEIDGPTGGALDGKMYEPGPILLQGDHGKVSFKNLRIKPLGK